MKKPSKIVRSSALSLKFSNAGKRAKVAQILAEYKRVVEIYVERFWKSRTEGLKVKRLPNKAAVGEVETWLSARMRQAAAKQAVGIVSACLIKNEQREFQARRFEKGGEFKKARALRAIIKLKSSSLPELSNLEAQLDSRFFAFAKGENSFDFWLNLVSTGSENKVRGQSVSLPLKSHKHFAKMQNQGKILKSVRLSNSLATFAFEIAPAVSAGDKVLGVDVGQTSIFSTSQGEQLVAGQHGWTLAKINARQARRKKGRKGFKRASSLRKNFTGAAVNRLNLSGVSTLRLEKIFDLKRGKATTRKLSHWSARDLFAALESKALLRGVRVETVNPAFTSQRCSNCGWVRKRNRSGECFKCASCDFIANADLNAAKNISLNLEVLPLNARSNRLNLNGFFWKEAHEPIVRAARKPIEKISVGKIFQ